MFRRSLLANGISLSLLAIAIFPARVLSAEANGAAQSASNSQSSPDDLSSLLGAPEAAQPAQEPAPKPADSAPIKVDEKVETAKPNAQPEPATPAELAVTPETNAGDGKGPVKNRVIEEIVVTAQKREEAIQTVPIAIQAFSGEALAARGIDDTTQLSMTVPSLQFTSVEGFTLLSIRGIGTDNFIPSADPSIATYVDGIYLPQGESTVNSLGNIQRVEVLKGPQGTLFGRNATGGAFSIVTQEPGDTFKASAEAETGNFAERSAKLNLSGPLTSWLSAGFSGMYSYEDSYYKDVFYEVEPTKLGSTRLKLNFHPLEGLTLGLTAFYSAQQGIGTNIGNTTKPSLLGDLVLIPPRQNTYTSNFDYPVSAKGKQELFYGNLTWKLRPFDIKLLGSDDQVRAVAYFDYDGSSLPLISFNTTNEFQKLQTGELQIVSNDTTWGADKFKWIAGLYYLHSVGGFDPAHFSVGAQAIQSGIQDLDTLTGLNIQLPEGLLNLFSQPPLLNTPLGNNGVSLEVHGLLGTNSYSAYTQGTYTFTDWLDLTLGGRFQREKRYLVVATVGLDNPLNNKLVPVFDFPTPSADATNFSPKAVLSLHLDDNKLVYVSYSVGFQSGTYNIISIYTAPNYVSPEKVKTYELGAKTEFFDGALRLNGAVFDNEITNLQTGFISLQSGGAVVFETVPTARTRGAEFDGTWLPIPNLDSGLVLTANAAYVDATYTNFPHADGFQTGTGLESSNLNFSGKEISRTPKLSGSVGFVQTIEFANGSLELAADEYYNGGFYFDAGNNNKQGPYGLLSAHASYLYAPWNLRATLFGKNILDRHYDIQQFQEDFGVTETLAAPREYGIRFNWNF